MQKKGKRKDTGSSTWEPGVEVTSPTDSARRPSVAVANGVLRVSFERDSSLLAQDVVVARREPNGTFTPEIIASTGRTDELDSILHVFGGTLWIDWKHDAGDFGRSEHESGTWSMMQTTPWTDSSWVGVEGARRQIQRLLLGP